MSALLDYRPSKRRRVIPWGMWISFFVVACLAHALLVIPGAALARLSKYEPKPEPDEVIELDLFPPPPPAPMVESDEPDDSPAAKPGTPTAKPEPRAPSGAKPKPEQPKAPTPGSEAPEDIPETDDDLVEAPDGEVSQPAAPTNKVGDWGKLGGSTDALQDTFGTRDSSPRPPPSEPPRESMLDNKANLFGSFFGRMRQRVQEHWDVDTAVKRNDPQGRKLGGISKTTRLLVQIDRQGKIEKVSVERGSDVDYLDAEAIRAVKAAGPFPNPPPGLFEDGDSFAFLADFTVLPDGSARIFRSSR